MKPTQLFTTLIVSCVISLLASACNFSTKDNIVGPNNPSPGNGNGNPVDSTTVSYLNDVQPIFDAKCITCHGVLGGLNLTSFDKLMIGGNTGLVVTAGDGAGSLLVKRIDGTIPPQMPMGSSSLSNAEVLLIKIWIDENASNN